MEGEKPKVNLYDGILPSIAQHLQHHSCCTCWPTERAVATLMTQH